MLPACVHCRSDRQRGREVPRAYLSRYPRQEAFREGPRTRSGARGCDRSRRDGSMYPCHFLSFPDDGDPRTPAGRYSCHGRCGVFPARSFSSSFLFYTFAGERATPDVVVAVPMWAANGRKSQADSGVLVSLRPPFSSSWLD